MKLKALFLTSIIFTVLFYFNNGYAHSGRTDSSGCHHNRKTGDYHCHNSKHSNNPQSHPNTYSGLGSRSGEGSGSGLDSETEAGLDPSAMRLLSLGSIGDSSKSNHSSPQTPPKKSKKNKNNAKGNTKIQSFSKAKKTLLNKIYKDRNTTFYCECKFKGKKITRQNGYVPKKKSKRAYRLEWEHIVPAPAFGKSFPEWSNGHSDCIDKKGKQFKGRKCARETSAKFRRMESDMYNLVPAVGEINGLRSNYSFTIIPGEKRQFGECDMEIQNSKAEPPPNIRGNIVRTYFYMDSAYPGHGIISIKNLPLFKLWDKKDPVDKWECERAGRIEKIQGNENRFVKEGCRKAGMWN